MSNEYGKAERKEITDIVGFDLRKLRNTLRDLTLKPGTAIDYYCNGDRQKYVSPIIYFVLVFAISFFVSKASGISHYVHSSRTPGRTFLDGLRDGSGQMDMAPLAIERIESQVDDIMGRPELAMFLILPGLILAQWLLFRKLRPSFIHNSYFVLFTLAHTTLAAQIFVP